MADKFLDGTTDDPAHPEKFPHRFKRTKCALCATCWFDVMRERCLYGGPFAEFVNRTGAYTPGKSNR